MNKAEAKREAHGAIAGLIRVNLFEGSDLTAMTEEWPDEDVTRFTDACEELADQHARRGPG